MSEVTRIQGYLRASAGLQYETVAIPPFSAFFHPTDDAIYFNYAIPVEVSEGMLDGPLAELRTVFHKRGRRPRLEFISEFAPTLVPALQSNGFFEDARLYLMICTPESVQPVSMVPGLEIIKLGPASAAEDLRDYALTVDQGFNPAHIEPPTDADVERVRRDLRNSRSFLGRLGDEPAGAASYTRPIDGVTEVVGIATREQFRGRGIAGAITERAVQSAFGEGVTLACLTTADARAGRVYARVGFQPYATMLFYIAPAPF
jgi:GNAT superfamily N-acetyltransferase